MDTQAKGHPVPHPRLQTCHWHSPWDQLRLQRPWLVKAGEVWGALGNGQWGWCRVLEFSATRGMTLGPMSQHLLGACEKCVLSRPTPDVLFQNLHFIKIPSDSYIHYMVWETLMHEPYAPRIKFLWIGFWNRNQKEELGKWGGKNKWRPGVVWKEELMRHL